MGRRCWMRSFAMNLSAYQVLGQPHPIDIAVQQFFVTALCPGSATAEAQPMPLPLPDISALNQLRG